MQIENPTDIVCAYANQATWLEHKIARLKKEGTSETDPIYVRIVGELNGCRNALDKIRGILAEPKGYWVQVIKSKVAGLAGRVGKVTYVNTKHNFAAVQFSGDVKPRNLGLGNLKVISLPPPTLKIPAAGMKVCFKDDPVEYVSIKWTATAVFVEPVSV